MTNETIVQYSDEDLDNLTKGWQAGKTLEDLAEQLGKTTKSVANKLTESGQFIPRFGARVTKAQMVAKIASILGISPTIIASIEKASMQDLESLYQSLYVLYELYLCADTE